MLGVALLLAGMLAFDWSSPNWRAIVWFFLGVGVIYYFVAKPWARRRRIKKSNEPQQDLALEFHDDHIKLAIGGVGDFIRKWGELVEFIDTRKGIIFYFSDGVVNWLPKRVFTDDQERLKFVEFLQTTRTKNEHASRAH